MAIIKCKMCGGDLILEEGSNVAECEYCGSRQTVPSADNEKKLNLFARANRLRANNEFDKASGVYESIVADFPEEAEAYWGLILCKYGIEYVDDPGTGKKIPTCHRSSFDSVMDDPNFELVMENAEPIARRVYREEAKQLEELRKGIIEVSSKEEPYDIFICYKETDDKGDRTLDSVLAQDVYDMLTENGYRVFFSRVTLEDKLGVEYEPYIFAALNSAKIMLAFGTDYDYYNAVWVKNEWSRFLQLIAKGEKKTLIPCYKNIDAYDMPKEFAKLQAQDLGKVGANQDLLRGIKKILPMEGKQAAFAEGHQALNTNGPTAATQVYRGQQSLEDKNWDGATAYFDKALDINPKCAEAFWGKALAAVHCVSNSEFASYRIQIAKKTMKVTEKLDAEAKVSVDTILRSVSKKYVLPYFLTTETIYSNLCGVFKDKGFEHEIIDWDQRFSQEKAFWEQDPLVKRAVTYANGSFADTLQSIRTQIETALEEERRTYTNKELLLADITKKAEKRAEELLRLAEERRKYWYDSACKNQANAKNIGDYNMVLLEFEKKEIREYLDSKKRAEQCRNEIARLKEKEKQEKYENACKIQEKADSISALKEAGRLFESSILRGYLDSNVRADQCRKRVEEAERKREENERKRRELSEIITATQQRQSAAKAELSSLKGLFTGKRRKELDAEIAALNTQIGDLQREIYAIKD